ncbi:hypothetical protein [Moraxella canis]|uniref:Uncharacterized protein n=1 Tax=Moraxella canis TaxID=90239 RepID=A0A1S9ZND0_9GAMM|nr:hypothetical protein [Moraxella canis]OOR84561.1 hypothetical protein B0180_03125 [Moraxella canis]
MQVHILNQLKISLDKDDDLGKILKSKDFYFQKAQDALIKFQELPLSKDEESFLFNHKKDYQKLRYEFETNSKYKEVGNLIFEIISYCDYHARDKDKLNQYDDNRTLAKAYVRMHSWVEHLISFKLDKQSISSVSVDNAIRYLLDPINNFTILSENHRKQICKVLQKPYDPTKFNEYLVDYFNAIDIPVKHPYNKNWSSHCFVIK